MSVSKRTKVPMQNTIYSLENLFELNVFRIPQYQRAYSWEVEPNVATFLEDLRQQVRIHERSSSKNYFLGTFLLHEETNGDSKFINVVDGQQRMTTVAIFMATAIKLVAKNIVEFKTQKQSLLKRCFVFDEDKDSRKFRTIKEDDPFFKSEILGFDPGASVPESASSKRMLAAAEYFETEVKPEEWDSLIQALRTARVMAYAVDNAEDATQIFELQNDRGKPLTSLESLKSYLMHCIYLFSKSNAEERLEGIQTQFAQIYRIIESLSDEKRAPNEDQLLSNHCAAFLEWKEKEYSKPKELVKSLIKGLAESEVIRWIENFVNSLVRSYKTVAELFQQRDTLLEFTELLLVGRMGAMWPLLIKTWRHDQSVDKGDFLKTCRLLEVFAFRGYAMSNLRADSAVSRLHRDARDFEGDFPKLFDRVRVICDWFNVEERFLGGLNNANLFNDDKNDARYLLWRYENHLRSQPGRHQPFVRWQDFDNPRSFAATFSIEHISAQHGDVAATVVEWDEGDPKPFTEVALHRLGNLVLDSVSLNSAKGKKDLAGKLASLTESSFLSQGELLRFCQDKEQPVWDLHAVRSRHQCMVEFAVNTWNPDTYHSLSSND
jgi:uncharacterized protein with ParB-like and HNH nuclease domain